MRTIESQLDSREAAYRIGDTITTGYEEKLTVIEAGRAFWRDIPSYDHCIYHCYGSFFQTLKVE